MFASALEQDGEFDPHAGLAHDERLRLGARRARKHATNPVAFSLTPVRPKNSVRGLRGEWREAKGAISGNQMTDSELKGKYSGATIASTLGLCLFPGR